MSGHARCLFDRTDALLIAALALVAAVAFAQSYRGWLHPLIDSGRDLYIPGRILQGARLYRDIRYEYPPLAPYLLALVTRLIGRGLPSYMLIGVGQSVGLAAAAYILMARAAGKAAGFLSVLLFVCLSFCGAST